MPDAGVAPEAKQSRTSSGAADAARQPGEDRFSFLPPEVLSDIFSYLAPDPPLPLSHRLLPYSRAARLATVDVVSVDQLRAFLATIRATPGLGGYVRSFCIGLSETTEAILALERPTLNELLAETLALLPAMRELQAVDWITASFVLSDNAETVCRNLESLRLSILLMQLNSLDFITYRLAVLGRYPRLRKLEVMVLPYDPASSTAIQVDLFPASDLSFPPLDMAPISQIEQLTTGGALCDQRIVNLLRAFRNLRDVRLYDSFASRHIAPALAALDTSSLRSLRLQRLVGIPPPVDLPPQPTDWSRFASVTFLGLSMPVCSDGLAAALPSFPNLEFLVFGPTSNPTAAQVRHILQHRPPSLGSLVLSHVTGEVGLPISSTTLPSIHSWLVALRAAADGTSSPSPIPPVFPLLDWRLPSWTAEFRPADVEALVPLAKAAGVALGGTVVSACLTSYVLEKQLALWVGEGDGEAPAEMDEGEREVLGRKEFWDALALRYKARLIGEDQAEGAIESMAR
ncbi:hypothetical protein Rhopal_002859-T1 [Rhodotorula paludigena]|uniref:F-box domain-containing protein n=1 Tax=Rhodotorula paludigena TaxID=86838 RepID=A0AAV5GBF9_9BASI|nr:hypothetical protein Rhopal_002859-T1 [Rhodotorula paludigena]